MSALKSSKVKLLPKNAVLLGVSLVAVVALSAMIATVSGFNIINPQAASLTPKITRRVLDRFNEGEIDSTIWETMKVTKGDSAKIVFAATSTDNLRITLPKDKESSWAGLKYKPTLANLADFAFEIVLYRPTVTGEGSARTGLQFRSAGTENDETAGLFWEVTGGSTTEDRIVFFVNDSTGKRRITKTQKISTKAAVLKLRRVDNTYDAYFKNGTDTSGDTPWQQLGLCDKLDNCNKGLGKSGNLIIYTNNGIEKDKYPLAVSRVDMASIRWEDGKYESPVATSFSDAFANGVVSKKWTKAVSKDSTITETKADNLVMKLPDTNTAKETSYARVVRNSPTVGVEQNFGIVASMFKPVVSGRGTGWAALSFVSADAQNKESASVRWVVTGTESKLVFVVKNRKGEAVEKVSAPITLNKVYVRLARTDTKYRAMYRAANDDSAWIDLGDAAEETLGENGKFMLSAGYTGLDGGPKTTTAATIRFDSVYGQLFK